MTREDKIFDDKSFNDILRDIYKKSMEKDKQIKLLIGELRPLIKNVGDATILVPIIKEYLEVAVKNDEHIVKLAAIVQRLITGSSSTAGESSLLSEEEKKQLLAELDTMTNDTPIKSVDEIKENLTPPTQEE